MSKRPDGRRFYDWQRAHQEGLTIHFGVAWYDRAFFEERKDAFKSQTHSAIFSQFNASADQFTVAHHIVP